jgi:hypothetical protein
MAAPASAGLAQLDGGATNASLISSLAGRLVTYCLLSRPLTVLIVTNDGAAGPGEAHPPTVAQKVAVTARRKNLHVHRLPRTREATAGLGIH